MQHTLNPSRATLRYLAAKVKALFTPKPVLPEELKALLQECTTAEQLLDLLFATDFHKDAAFMDAFERRMNEIDPPF